MQTISSTGWETQKEMAQLINKGWYFFLLGLPISYPQIITRLARRYFTGDSGDWVKHWGIALPTGGFLHIVALDCQYLPRAQLDAELGKQGAKLCHEGGEVEGTGDTHIFVPTTTEDPTAMEFLRNEFMKFLQFPFPRPPVPLPPDPEMPVVVPQIMAVNPKQPELVAKSHWHRTGNPYVPFLRYTLWILTGGSDEIVGMMIGEQRDSQDMVTGETLMQSKQMFDTPHNREEIKRVLTGRMEAGIRHIDELKARFLPKGSPHGQEETRASQPQPREAPPQAEGAN